MNPIMKFFAYEHLPPKLQEVSKPIGELAKEMDAKLPDSAEKSAGLRKLLEAKDCFVRAALALLLVVACGEAVSAQCSNGRCGTSSFAPVLIPATQLVPQQSYQGYHWHPVPGHPDQLALYLGSLQLGNWHADAQTYTPKFRDRWGTGVAQAPITPPAEWMRQPAVMQPWQRTGVIEGGLHTDERYTVGGRQKATSPVVVEPVADESMPDDSKLPWLIISGTSEAKRQQASKDLRTNPEYAEWLRSVRLWDGPGAAPNAPMMLDRDSGKPMHLVGSECELILERADGVVLWHETAYRGDESFRALRKAAGYDPTKDPGPGRLLPRLGIPDLPWDLLAGGLLGLVAVGAFSAFRRR